MTSFSDPLPSPHFLRELLGVFHVVDDQIIEFCSFGWWYVGKFIDLLQV